MRSIIARKIMKVREAMRTLNVVVLGSLIYGAFGLSLCHFIYFSNLVFLESIIWLMEALAFFGSIITIRLITSKTLHTSRYELLRTEVLISLFLMLITAGVAGKLLISAIFHTKVAPTPFWFAFYFFGGALLSYAFYLWIYNYHNFIEIKLLFTKAALEKLKIDSLIEAVAGICVILNTFSSLIEKTAIILLSSYVLYESLKFAKSLFAYLIGVTDVEEDVKRNIRKIAERVSGYKIRRLITKSFGSFVETEIWLEAPYGLKLDKAHKIAVKTAKTVIVSIPEVVRALVILIPGEKSGKRKREFIVLRKRLRKNFRKSKKF